MLSGEFSSLVVRNMKWWTNLVIAEVQPWIRIRVVGDLPVRLGEGIRPGKSRDTKNYFDINISLNMIIIIRNIEPFHKHRTFLET